MLNDWHAHWRSSVERNWFHAAAQPPSLAPVHDLYEHYRYRDAFWPWIDSYAPPDDIKHAFWALLAIGTDVAYSYADAWRGAQDDEPPWMTHWEKREKNHLPR